MIKSNKKIERRRVNNPKPDGIYAVKVQDDVNSHWGIVVLNSFGMVRRSWNVLKDNAWVTGYFDITNVHFYHCTQMEFAFAKSEGKAEEYIAKNNEARQELEHLRVKIRCKNRRIIQRIANWLMRDYE